MIAIIDYGVGNINAFVHVYKQLDIACRPVSDAAGLEGVTGIILPGVGSFDHAASRLRLSGLQPALTELVLDKKTPVLGVCVGMQLLASGSEEGALPGLGWIDATVRKLPSGERDRPGRLPHMGWNDAQLCDRNRLTEDMGQDACFYFLHSYYFSCNRPEDIIAVTAYNGLPFPSAVNHAHIYGVQFHPEKSHHHGMQLLKNFAAI